MNFASCLAAVAEKAPSRMAVAFSRGNDPSGRAVYREATFQQLNEESDRYAHGLAKIGIGRGCRALLMVPPGIEFLALAFGLFKIGAVLILIDPGMGRKNLLHCIREAEPEAVIAVPLLHALRGIYRGPFKHVKHAVTVGRRWFWRGPSLGQVREQVWAGFPVAQVGSEETAAVVFTTGTTGVPKGVVYSAGILTAQLRSIQGYFRIEEGEAGLPAFAPFGLFCVAMGTTCVLPPMDPTRLAQVDAEEVIRAIEHYKVGYSFGSPAFWNRVSLYGVERDRTLPSMQKILLAGAPVSEMLLRRLQDILPPGAESHTPYGATEALPVTSISGSEILAEAARRGDQLAGICVGKALPGMAIKIIRISDAVIPEWDEAEILPPREIGEIVVRGPVVTKEYHKRQDQTALAKIRDGGSVWHRMGDVGYLDEKERLWFCGRKSQRVVMNQKTLFTVPCEAIFNQHPEVSRSALVGIGPRTSRRPVIVVEPKAGRMPARGEAEKEFARELLDLGSRSELTREIKDVLFHPALPVDFRHNAKILREDLARWAEGRIL